MRMSIRKPAATGLKALYDLEAYLNDSPVPRTTLDLLRLRVSQINGCSFCVDMHAREARQTGVSDQRLHALAAWRDTPSSPTMNVPPSRSPRRPHVSPTARAASPTRCGTRRRTTTTKGSWRRWS
ncbi:carboxymuconolactone decarboxylase family protein [Nonomuraea thailandensis]